MFFNLGEEIREEATGPWASAWRVESFLASGKHFRHYLVRSLAPEMESQRAVLKVIKYDPRHSHKPHYVEALRQRLRHERDTLAHYSPRLPEPIDFFHVFNNQDGLEGFGSDQDRRAEPILVRTLVHGTSLARMMEVEGAPPAGREDVLMALVHLCGFLHELHAGGRGWLFWEMTPEHIIVDPAQSYEPSFVGSSNFRMLRDGVAVRSALEEALGWAAARPEPGYAAPELLARGEVGVEADLYGLGALIFHLFSGTDPRSLAEEILGAQGLGSAEALAQAMQRPGEAQDFAEDLRVRLEHLCRRNLKGLGIHRARIRRLLLRLLDPRPEARGVSPLEAREEILSCLSRSMPSAWSQS